ncbi:MAG: RNA polymerase sigma factor [Lachnospiraceae bacterium]
MKSIQIEKRDKHNPYTLMIVEGRYYLSFKDGRGVMQNIEIDKVLYELFNRFELEDISYLNRVSRHIEHSELTEASLNDRAFYKAESLEETVSRSIEYELLHKAISKLPETQRRRLLLYFFGELTYEQIAELEGCTKRAVKFSIDLAIEKLRKVFDFFKF